uniref:Uncharacterized protein n=1 Tax=Tetranychus urticae TaxID=32264 RepID=T1KVP1_TETUR
MILVNKQEPFLYFAQKASLIQL